MVEEEEKISLKMTPKMMKVDVAGSVAKCFELRGAIFLPKSATKNFPKKLTPKPFLLHFYALIF